MRDDGDGIIDWVHFEKSRGELGPGFIRILGYYREDGAKSVARIEQAMREQDTVALVIPAHTLKGESQQFGANPLAELAKRGHPWHGAFDADGTTYRIQIRAGTLKGRGA